MCSNTWRASSKGSSHARAPRTPHQPTADPRTPDGRPAVSNVQAMARSQAGSPTPHVPKSTTAANFPSLSRSFPSATSPWNQRSTLSQRASSEFTQISRANSTSTWVQYLKRALGIPVVGAQCAAPEPVVNSALGTVSGVDALQGGQEAGQVDGESDQVGNAVRGRSHAIEPLVDRPRMRVIRARLAFRPRDGDW